MRALVVDTLTVARGGPVVNDISLTVRPGEITAVLGPNGSGKTSMLEAISGVLKHRSGSITLDDHDISHASRQRRAALGLVHVQQGRMVFPTLTVKENIALATRDPARRKAVMVSFPELNGREESPAMLLSGGEQQMVVLARALAAGPTYLLVDEMSSGLAPVVFRRLLPVLREVADSGVGVLLVEQFAQHALAIADHALVMASGRAVFEGDARDLLADSDLLHRSYLGREPTPTDRP